MEVIVREYQKMGMDGDRAQKKSPYLEWEIMVNGFVVNEFSEYDGFMVNIDTLGHTKRDARKYAYDLAESLNCGDPRFVTMKREFKETWVEEERND